MSKIFEIDSIGNNYGCLNFREYNGKFYWSIEGYNGQDWEEIPESLYQELLKFWESENE